MGSSCGRYHQTQVALGFLGFLAACMRCVLVAAGGVETQSLCVAGVPLDFTGQLDHLLSVLPVLLLLLKC